LIIAMVSAAVSCLICKGSRMLCGLQRCPVLGRFAVKARIEGTLREDYFGSATSVFVGRHGYPNVDVGPMSPLGGGDASVIDNPSKWFGMDYAAIVEMRSSLLRSKRAADVRTAPRTMLDLQEIALASRPPDVEMRFARKPVYRVSFSDVVQPMGPSAALRSLAVAGDVKVRGRVESIVSDDLTARDAGFLLYSSGEDVYKISTILSSGALGFGARRKLVPTRWSITASQTMVADRLIRDVKQLPSVSDFMVFSSSYLDNHYEILLMPGSWEFENFEAWAPGTPWSMAAKKTEVLGEYEPNGGRSSYADLQGGGFYASRLGVAEGLKALGRQARVVAFREVREGYVVPLGVWQVLENVRNAFRGKRSRFGSREEALADIGQRLRVPVRDYASKSVALRQRRLGDFR